MKFIDANQLTKVKALAEQGDEKAKDFLFNFMEMSDDEANAYLSSIAVNEKEEPKENTENDWKAVVEDLIKEENKAIDSYDKAIKYITNSDLPDLVKTAYLEKINHIKNEEIEHIEELKEIM